MRLPISWERAQPKLGGPLAATYISGLKAFIESAALHGLQVVVDLHNYGRYNRRWAEDAAANYGYVAVGNGDVIGSDAVPITAFVDFWIKVSAELKGMPGLGYYEIMNNVHDMGHNDVWPFAAQSAVDAIRSVDIETPIIVQGDHWASAFWWPLDNGNLHITDPSGKVIYGARLYCDGDGSGRYLESYDESGAYPMIGGDRLQPFVTWLRENNASGFLVEFGVPATDPQWLPVLDNLLGALKAAGMPGTYWNYTFHSASDPMWWPVDDPLSIRLDNGQENPQMPILLKYSSQQ